MLNFEREYLEYRKNVIEHDFSRMNNMQLEAVTETIGPVLILAGAGSGKTTVLVNRIAYMVKYGNAYNSCRVPNVDYEIFNKLKENITVATQNSGYFCDEPIDPWNILAITFTNKAADELKQRISNKLGDKAKYINAGTFHSVCSKILRRECEFLGYDSHFTIYDTDDQKRLMRDILKGLNIDDKQITPKSALGEISRAKDRLISAQDFEDEAGNDLRLKLIAKAYKAYQKRLVDSNAMDFDDLIFNTVTLFLENPKALSHYQNLFKFILVDEYQDTNHAQYMLIKLLSESHRNICVVGDDDQSIYRFRGATIENILSFEKEYPDAKVVRLEQNYRSTQNILDAANAVISNNKGRTGKSLWTARGSGDKITHTVVNDENDEARFVAETVLEHVHSGGNFRDCAVLYRMNAQSNQIENVFARSGIPYRVIGGLRFYERKEIKDVISYLNVINNPADDMRLKRIINEPKRGIGATTVNNAAEIAENLGIPLFEVFKNAKDYPAISRSASKLTAFCDIIEGLICDTEVLSITELLKVMLEKTGYGAYLDALPSEEGDRKENVEELLTSIIHYEQETDESSLSGFLEEVSLISDIDSFDESADATVLMTLHSAKGLEFDTVFMVGMEEGIFPSTQTIYGGIEELEEERRIAYVGITRAKRKLYLTNATRRMIYGKTNYNPPSTFLEEVPDFLLDTDNRSIPNYSVYNVFEPTATYTKTTHTQKTASGSKIQFSIGESVEHYAFGEGVIVNSVPMGNDTLLEVNFAQVGTKKLMANFSKLKKIF